MIFQKSEFPGSHERHLLRRNNNPLFQEKQTEVDDDSMLAVQKADHEEIISFHEKFNRALDETVALKPNEESDIILALKDRLERLYEQACRIGDDQTDNKDALQKLLSLIMGSIRQGAGNDAQAHSELDQEETARKTHFQLLNINLVADLLNPKSVIEETALVPTLLTSNKDVLSQVLQIFDEQQLVSITAEANALVSQSSDSHNVKNASEALAFIEGYIKYLKADQ